MIFLTMVIAAGAAAASPAVTTPAVTAPAAELIAFKHADVLVVDAAGAPLFRSSRDYLLKMTRNPTGAVVRHDPAGRRVLLSNAGPEYWVGCAELAPMATSCPAPLAKPATRSIRIPRAGSPDAGLAARGLPACPGDPRCPKAD